MFVHGFYRRSYGRKDLNSTRENRLQLPHFRVIYLFRYFWNEYVYQTLLPYMKSGFVM